MDSIVYFDDNYPLNSELSVEQHNLPFEQLGQGFFFRYIVLNFWAGEEWDRLSVFSHANIFSYLRHTGLNFEP